jgi:hypothetical protein
MHLPSTLPNHFYPTAPSPLVHPTQLMYPSLGLTDWCVRAISNTLTFDTQSQYNRKNEAELAFPIFVESFEQQTIRL